VDVRWCLPVPFFTFLDLGEGLHVGGVIPQISVREAGRLNKAVCVIGRTNILVSGHSVETRDGRYPCPIKLYHISRIRVGVRRRWTVTVLRLQNWRSH
jgi:hypothetical protein